MAKFNDSVDKIVSTNELMDLVYPVGSLYYSFTNPNNPSTYLCGGGTWQQITDTFILAAGDNFDIGLSGGEVTHKLVVNEIPQHGHYFPTHIDYGNPQHIFSQWAVCVEYTNQVTASVGESRLRGDTTFTGGSLPHNNMPPFITAYCWKRVA